MTSSIMQRVFAITATTNMEETKNHGNVLMRNFMLLACVKIAT
jgi:hypothetical protein